MDLALRILQLFCRYASTSLVAHAAHYGLTLKPEDVNGVENVVFAALSALLLAIIDHVLHRAQKSKTAPDDNVWRSPMILLVPGLCAALTMSGCNSTDYAAAAGSAASAYLLNHVAGVELTYDSTTGTFGVHANVKESRRGIVQREANRLNGLSDAEKCKASALVDKANYIATAKQRDADLKAIDKRELKAFDERKKNCGNIGGAGGSSSLAPSPGGTTSAPPIILPPVELVELSGRNRVLLIGDNYLGTDAELHECVRDVQRDADYLVKYYGFKREEIRFLLNEQCTSANIKEGLRWAFMDAHAGDHRGVSVSGHGAEDTDDQGRIVDVMVTYDMVSTGRWDASTEVTLEDWRAVLKSLQPGVNAFVKLDICHAGGAIRPLLRTGRTVRSIDGPAPVLARVDAATKRASFKDMVESFNCSFIAACGAGQLSEESSTTGGAFTCYFWQSVDELGAETSAAKLTSRAKSLLKSNGFSQSPEARGATVARALFK